MSKIVPFPLRRLKTSRIPAPPAALSEIEAAYVAGFRSLRAWRYARRHGGFPEPARVTRGEPVWTVRQIAEWLNEEPGVGRGEPLRGDAEAALLRELGAA